MSNDRVSRQFKKEVMLKSLTARINALEDEEALKKILDKVAIVNEECNPKDSRLKNLFDDITVSLAPTTKAKITRVLSDIFDKYDARDKKTGEFVYSDFLAKKIEDMVQQVTSICDQQNVEMNKHLHDFRIVSKGS